MSVRAQIVELLADLQREHGIACLFVAPRSGGGPASVAARRGDVPGPASSSRQAPAAELFGGPGAPVHARAPRGGAVARPGGAAPAPTAGPRGRGPRARRRRPPGCAFHPRCPEAVARCRSEAPGCASTRPGGGPACHLVGQAAASPRVRARRIVGTRPLLGYRDSQHDAWFQRLRARADTMGGTPELPAQRFMIAITTLLQHLTRSEVAEVCLTSGGEALGAPGIDAPRDSPARRCRATTCCTSSSAPGAAATSTRSGRSRPSGAPASDGVGAVAVSAGDERRRSSRRASPSETLPPPAPRPPRRRRRPGRACRRSRRARPGPGPTDPRADGVPSSRAPQGGAQRQAPDRALTARGSAALTGGRRRRIGRASCPPRRAGSRCRARRCRAAWSSILEVEFPLHPRAASHARALRRPAPRAPAGPPGRAASAAAPARAHAQTPRRPCRPRCRPPRSLTPAPTPTAPVVAPGSGVVVNRPPPAPVPQLDETPSSPHSPRTLPEARSRRRRRPPGPTRSAAPASRGAPPGPSRGSRMRPSSASCSAPPASRTPATCT